MSPALSDLLYVAKEHFFGNPQWHPRPGLLSGRVVIVTGSNTGLGLETAVQLGKLNPSLVVLACRNVSKGEEAKVKVMKESVVKDGMHPFKPHMTILGSLAHIFAPNPSRPGLPLLPALNDQANPSIPIGDPRYNFTKLGSLFLTRQLARIDVAKGVVVNCVNPGLCMSDFRREYTGIGGWLLDKMAWSTEKGTRSICWAATEATPCGAYIDSAAVRHTSVFANSEAGLLLERQLWDEMVNEWVKAAPEVKKLVG